VPNPRKESNARVTPLLDIAPDQDRLIVQAQISTLDIEGVRAGNVAEVRFPAFHDRTLPMIAGTIKTISQDRLIDEASKQPYYLAVIDVPEENIPARYRGKVASGMKCRSDHAYDRTYGSGLLCGTIAQQTADGIPREIAGRTTG
jgi:hypothetical protein